MKVIVDTDVGIDDAMSLTFLSACKDVELVAVTLVAGNAETEIVAPNLEKISTYIGEKSTPLYVGGSFNMGGRLIKSDGYFGKNALGEIELPDQEVNVSREMSSVEALLHYSRKYPKEIHAIFIGPLTNLAIAFLCDNQFPTRLASIIIMGTDSSESTHQNVTPHAEFNAWCDPWAYNILKDCISPLDVPITIVEWSTCWTSLLPFSMIEDIKAHKSRVNNVNRHLDLFHKFTDETNVYIKKNFWETGFLTADLFAAVGLTHLRIFKNVKKVNITHVETVGERIGHVKYEDHPHGRLNLVKEIDTDEMAKVIIDTLVSV
ncbi:Uridine nucleosidase 1 [Thelohanellus kitauei]|uniref:Uridine nucleosidase 1 n=1 Tax=Thelohanellus kitauei TaxID=669202 RepID=A0A0C2NKZ9_THEKT|nr:Uridine nucleosidase 1 [Thelohanellus kitauei]